MKKTFILLLTSILLFSCGNDYKLENKIYKCIDKTMKENGIQLQDKVKQAETVLVDYGFFENNEAESYITFIEYLAETGTYPIGITDDLISGILSVDFPEKIYCSKLKQFDESDFKDTKFEQLFKIWKKIEKSGNFEIQFVCSELLKVFEAKDFDNKLYRTYAVYFIIQYISLEQNSGITRVLPPPSNNEEPFKINERNVLIVFIDKTDKIFIEGKESDLKEVKPRVKQFFSNPDNDSNLSDKKEIEIEGYGKIKSTKGVISLQNDRATSYNEYINLQNEIVSAINELRDELSNELFESDFDLLPENKQEVIKKAYPFAISEAEPTDF